MQQSLFPRPFCPIPASFIKFIAATYPPGVANAALAVWTSTGRCPEVLGAGEETFRVRDSYYEFLASSQEKTPQGGPAGQST